MSTPDANAQVSVEQDGRVLTGVGVSVDTLAATMDRHTPDPEPAALAPSEVAPPTPAEPPQTRGRQRFSDLTKERDSAKAETAAERTKRETLEREVSELRAQLQRASTPQQQQQAQQQLHRAEDRQAAQQGQRFTFPSYETWVEANPAGSYDDWQDAKLDARDAWRDQQRPPVEHVVRQSLEAERATRSFLDTVAATHTKARTVYKDFDQLLASGPGALIPLGPTPQEAMARAAFVIQHPHSEHLQVAILRDAALATRLQQMDPVSFGMAIAQLAPSLSSASPASLTASGSVTPPAPFQPVGSGSPTTVTPSAELASRGFDFDKSGYREKRAAERGLRRR